MKLTPENQDNMDGRPPRKSTIQGDDAALQVVYQAAKARSTSESR